MRSGRHTLLLLLLAVCTSWLRAEQRPNVILITVDTLRADHLEAYGYEGGRTPTITMDAARRLDPRLFERKPK